jgi:hypothetical protein
MASYLPPNTQPPIFDPIQFIGVTSASASTGTISDIQDTINATQTIIDNDTAIINTIGSVIYTNFNRNNQVSGTVYTFTMGPVVPGGFYVGSVILQAQCQTQGFGFIDGGYLNIKTISGAYPATKPMLYPSNGGTYGCYQQLFFAVVADSTGLLTFNYKFINKAYASSTTCPFSVNQQLPSNIGRAVRIR